ncbi:hypothetical protein, conserved [Trypanosoma brucei brucei TREU927]|uniref:Uncharacterized protein n=1 Tax=Trypanosoma brucei brucei (strain 927/4 GUTat10.1) TaxID=185431 RepID=Q583D5_TRYB2|nr:hypothetical protein, conserved [Trypanosoma brucei brucei TREU927]AAX80520.1 hypothetical protein, conserved [Trypanosoma brucei]AAZ11040.1 hypothetical protein, conserved [Trypanosoma brucei brucei TREU927]
MSECPRREVGDSWRKDKPLVEGRRSQYTFATNVAPERKSLHYTSSNTCTNSVTAANDNNAGNGGSNNRYFASVSGVIASRSVSAGRMRAPLSSAVRAADGRVSSTNWEDPAGSQTTTSLLTSSSLPSPSLLLPERPISITEAPVRSTTCHPHGNMKDKYVRARSVMAPMQSTPQLGSVTCSSGRRISTSEGVRIPYGADWLTSERISSVQISPRVSSGVTRSSSGIRCVGAANSKLGFATHSPQMRVVNSSRSALSTYARGGDVRDAIPAGRYPSVNPSISTPTRVASARNGESGVAAATLTNDVIHVAAPRATETNNNSNNVNTEVAATAVPDTTLVACSGAQGMVVSDKCMFCTEKFPAPADVSRRLSFDDGCGGAAEPNSSVESRGAAKMLVEVSARLPEHASALASADSRHRKEMSRVIPAPVQLRAGRDAVTATITSTRGVVGGTDNSCTQEAPVAGEVQARCRTLDGRAKSEDLGTRLTDLSHLHSYVGTPVGGSGQRPFIRHSVRGVDSGRAKLAVAPSLAALRDHTLRSALRPGYNLWSGRYSRSVTQVRLGRSHSAGTRLTSSPSENGKPLFNNGSSCYSTRSHVHDNGTAKSSSCKQGEEEEEQESGHAVSVTLTTAGGRLERAARRPIPPASHRNRPCPPADTTAASHSVVPSGRNTINRTSSEPNPPTEDRNSTYLSGPKPTPSNFSGIVHRNINVTASLKGVETVPSFVRRSSGLCPPVEQELGNRLRVESHPVARGAARESGYLCVASVRLARCTSGRIGPQLWDCAHRDDRCPQQRHSFPVAPLQRSATAPPSRQRLLKVEEAGPPVGDAGSVNASTSAASILLRMRSGACQQRVRVQTSHQNSRGDVHTGCGKGTKGESYGVADQPNQQHKFNRGSGSGSGSSACCYGVSDSNTPGEVTERVEKSHGRPEEAERTRPSCSLRGYELHVHRRDETVDKTAGIADDDVQLRDRIINNTHNSSDGMTSHASFERGTKDSRQHVGYNDRIREGYDADSFSDDYYDESDCSDEDSWWFFWHFWSGPAIVVFPPAFVPPLKLDNLRIPNDDLALTRYAIPMPTAVQRSPTRTPSIPPVNVIAPPVVSAFSSSSACSGSRRKRASEIKQAKPLVEGRKEREINIKLLLLEAAERRERRLVHQEEAADRKALQQQWAKKLEY